MRRNSECCFYAGFSLDNNNEPIHTCGHFPKPQDCRCCLSHNKWIDSYGNSIKPTKEQISQAMEIVKQTEEEFEKRETAGMSEEQLKIRAEIKSMTHDDIMNFLHGEKLPNVSFTVEDLKTNKTVSRELIKRTYAY